MLVLAHIIMNVMGCRDVMLKGPCVGAGMWSQQNGEDGPGNGKEPPAEHPPNLLHSLSSAPPEAGPQHLTPWNDPESTFAQRPVPPTVQDHQVVIEVRPLTATEPRAQARLWCDPVRKVLILRLHWQKWVI